MKTKKPKLEIILKKEDGLPIIFFRNFESQERFLTCWQYAHAEATYQYFRGLKSCNLDDAKHLLNVFKEIYFEFEILIKKRLKFIN